MPDPKQLKFQFTVDEASLQKTRQLIRELTSDLTKLSNGMKGAFGGPGGGGGGINVTGGGSQSSQNQQVIAKTPAAGKALVQGFLDQKDIFKGIADGSKNALKSMTDGLKQAVAEQQRALAGLKQSLQQLDATYNSLSDTDKSGAKGRKLLGKIQRNLGHTAKADTNLAELNALMSSGNAPSGGASDPDPTRWQRFKSWIGAKDTWMPQGGLLGKNSAVGGLMSRMGMSPKLLGGAGLVTMGAWGLKNIGDQIWNGPMQQGQADAAWGQTFGARGMDIRNAEFRNMTAQSRIFGDAQKKQDYESLDSGWRRFAHSGLAFVKGDFNEALSGRAADLGVHKRRQEMEANERASDPLTDATLGDFQNYQGTISTLRSMGMGPRKGENGYQALSRIRAGYAGWTDGEIAGARGTLEGAGTRHASYGMIGNALQAQAAGIGGAGSSAGIMARFGGAGAGNAFLNRLRGNAGSGADAVTMGILGQYVAGQQANVGMGLGGGAFQGEGLLNMLSAGTVGDGGRVIAEQNIRGADYLSRSTTGQTSPYQSARNTMIAMQSAPGLNVYGGGFLSRKMSLTELADAANGGNGDVSEMFKAGGGNKQMAAEYFKRHTQSLLEGVSGDALGNTSAGKIARAMSASGVDPKTFFQKKLYKKAGLSEKDALSGYAFALQSSDANMDPATAMGLARDITGVGGRPGTKHKAGDSAGGATQEMEMAKQHLGALAQSAVTLKGDFDQLAASTKNLIVRQEFMREFAQNPNMDEKQRTYIERALDSKGANSREQVLKIANELSLIDQVKGQPLSKARTMMIKAGYDYRQFEKDHGLVERNNKVE